MRTSREHRFIASFEPFEDGKIPPLLGQSRAMRTLRERILQVAPGESRVLIQGESGTGKELVARWIHHLSPRASRALEAVNCAAIPSELIESELFGHERGAFTGAVSRRRGRFETAGSGTLFLDEIGELRPDAQAKLLRALQERRFHRLGSEASIPFEARILAATNQPLLQHVQEGRFRLDLYHRIAVIVLDLPPLRAHPEDIPELAESVLQDLGRRDSTLVERTLTPSAVRALKAHPWPGNVRELQNVLERAAVFSEGRVIGDQDILMSLPSARAWPVFPSLSPPEMQPDITTKIPPDIATSIQEGKDPEPFEYFYSESDTFESFRQKAERWFLMRKLIENGWNITRTAEQIRMPRSHLYTKMHQLGIRR